jgi:hypothetical protein
VGCEMLKIPHCLDNRLTVGGKAVSLTHRPRSPLQKHYFPASDTHLSKPQGLVRLEGLGKFKIFSYLIGSRNRKLPDYRTLPQPLRYCVPHEK